MGKVDGNDSSSTWWICVLGLMCAQSPAYADSGYYACRTESIVNLISGQFEVLPNRSALLDSFQDITFSSGTGRLTYGKGKEIGTEFLSIIQQGSSENSLVAVGFRVGDVSNPRFYLVINAFKPGKDFFIDLNGFFLTGKCQ